MIPLIIPSFCPSHSHDSTGSIHPSALPQAPSHCWALDHQGSAACSWLRGFRSCWWCSCLDFEQWLGRGTSSLSFSWRSLFGSMSEPAATIPQRSGISVTTGRAAKGCVTVSHPQGTGCRLSLLRKKPAFSRTGSLLRCSFQSSGHDWCWGSGQGSDPTPHFHPCWCHKVPLGHTKSSLSDGSRNSSNPKSSNCIPWCLAQF